MDGYMNERGGSEGGREREEGRERVFRCHLLQVLLSSCGDGDILNNFPLKADSGGGRGHYMTDTEGGEGGREGEGGEVKRLDIKVTCYTPPYRCPVGQRDR